MATVTTSNDYYLIHANGLDFSLIHDGSQYTRQANLFRVDYESGWFDQFEGSGLSYSADGNLAGGHITTYSTGIGQEVGVRITDLSLEGALIEWAADTPDDWHDDASIIETAFWASNRIFGANLDDHIYGGERDDILAGYGGNDTIEGGDGIDTALFTGVRKQYAISGNADSRTVSSTAEGDDTLTSVERLNFVDGRLVFDNADPAAVVLRMYDATFGRAPDVGGFNHWIAALQHGTSAEAMAGSFAASPEFAATYGSLSSRGFVEQLYHNVLDREGEASGVSYWSNLLNQGTMSRGQVLLGFSESPEHVAKLQPTVAAGLWDVDESAAQAARAYAAAFDRAPDADGLIYWTRLLKDGGSTPATMAEGFVHSGEFAAKYGALSNQHFVEQLYLNVLDRAGDADGTAYWTGRLNSGAMDRGDVLFGFAESPENILHTLPTMGDGILLA